MRVLDLTRTHAAQSLTHDAAEYCPACDQPVPPEQIEEVRRRFETRAREQQAEHHQRLSEQYERKLAAAELRVREEAQAAAAAALAAKLAEAESERKAAQARIDALMASQDAIVSERVALAREAAEREKMAAVQAEQARSFEQHQKLQEQLQSMQRQLENKTARDLGEAAEIDLFQVLKAEFPNDRITRVSKGAAGADIVHDVVHNGAVCGRIVYDAKNRNAWRNEYVTKLRQDQIAAEAGHAVLAARVFPAERQQLHEHEGVLIAHPARVAAVAALLRRHIVQTHHLRISGQAREQKTTALYAFMTSQRCRQLLESVETCSGKMLALEQAEQRAHKRTWDERDKLIKAVQKTHGDLAFEVERIVGTAQPAGEDVDK